MIDYQKVGNKIRTLRTSKNLTQEEFSEEIGISVSYLGKIERGQRLASIKTLEKICKILNAPIDTLICDLTEAEIIDCIWREKSKNLSENEKQAIISILETILELLNSKKKI